MVPAWIETYLERRDRDQETRRDSEHLVATIPYTAPCEACGEDAPWTSSLYEVWNEQGFVRGERHESTSHCPCEQRTAV